MPNPGPADDAVIREQAYYLWEQDGRPEGRETEFWQRAAIAVSDKAQLDTLTKPAPKKAKAEPAKAKAETRRSKPVLAKAEAAKKPKKK